MTHQQNDPPHQQNTLVCGRTMTTAPENYPQASFAGRRIHFCTHICLECFEADPERFYNAHSRKKDALTSATARPANP